MTFAEKIQIGIGIITVLAVIAGPILALYIQNRVNIRRETRERKFGIFKTLMATRALRLTPEHVTALNMLDVEFYGEGNQDRDVIRAWNIYRDHLNSGPQDPKDPKYQEKADEWIKEGDRLFHLLLDKVAKAVGYDFEELLLRKGSYIPKAQRDLETEQFLLRTSELTRRVRRRRRLRSSRIRGRWDRLKAGNLDFIADVALSSHRKDESSEI